MAYLEPKKYFFYVELPDGKHLLVHNTNNQARNKEEIADLYKELEQCVAQNPDARVLYDTVRQYSDHSEVLAEAKKLREEDPDRPLATDLGLDRTNRLLTNPEVSRTIASARELQQGSTRNEA